MIKKMIGIVALLALAVGVEAQSTNFTFSSANTGPYYSVSNLIVVGSATLLANDPVGNQTNNYTNGTNYNNGLIYPAGIKNSLNVSFGLIVTTTNASDAGTNVLLMQEGTGAGDWTTLSPPIVVTYNGLGTWSSNATYNVGGFNTFRIQQISRPAYVGAYSESDTVGTSSKPGI